MRFTHAIASAAGAPGRALVQRRHPTERLKIIIRDDNYMRMQAPLSFAYDFLRRGVHVDVLFMNLAVRALTAEGAASLGVDSRHPEEEAWFRRRLADVGAPTEVRDWLEAIKNAGIVTPNGCRDSAEVLEVAEEDLVPEASGLVDSSDFIEQAVDAGVHCMYF